MPPHAMPESTERRWRSDLRTAGVHEAGHFIVGGALDIPIAHARVTRDGDDVTGITTHRRHRYNRDIAPALAATSLAGQLAEERWLREQGCPPTLARHLARAGAAGDEHNLTRYLRLGDTTRADAHRLASRLLNHRWRRVVDRGHLLAHRRTLRGRNLQ